MTRQNQSRSSRWFLAHAGFFALSQGAALSLAQGAKLMAVGRDPSPAISDATIILMGCAAALHYAGDFDPATYEAVVLPMMPEAFSGRWSPEHAALLLELTRARRTLDSAKLTDPHGVHQLLLAVEASYRSHAWICESVAGARPSLAGSALPGPEELLTVRRPVALGRLGYREPAPGPRCPYHNA